MGQRLKAIMGQHTNKIIEILWQFFISLKLTFFLLSVLVVGAVIGMCFDQTLSFSEFFQANSSDSFLTKLLSFFELYDAFHSWWFSLAILLLSANLIACSFERLPRIYFDVKNPRPYLTERRLMALSNKTELITDSMDQAIKVTQNFLKTVKPQVFSYADKKFFYAEKATIARFGVYVVHIALLIVMFSAIYATQNGIDATVFIEEGRSSRFVLAKGAGGVSYTYDLGFYIGCDDFRLKTFVDNSPMEYESDLFVSNTANTRISNKTVRVNEPLSYAGFTFYQSSYRALASEKIVEVRIRNKQGFDENFRVLLNMPINLPKGTILTIAKFYEDFAGLGQALRVEEKDALGKSTYYHIFRRYPDFDQIVRNGDYYLTFIEADQIYATGLSIGYVPGISVIFSGFMLFMLGLFLCFFMTPIRYFARIEQDFLNNKVRVQLASQGFRNYAAVKEDFEQRCQIAIKNINEGLKDV